MSPFVARKVSRHRADVRFESPSAHSLVRKESEFLCEGTKTGPGARRLIFVVRQDGGPRLTGRVVHGGVGVCHAHEKEPPIF